MNTYLKTLAVTAVVAFGSMGFAMADQWDKKTTITIDEPVQLPTTTLQPGTYVIRLLATSAADRHTRTKSTWSQPSWPSPTSASSPPEKVFSPSGKHLPDSPRLCAPGSTLVTTSVKNSRIRRRKPLLSAPAIATRESR
jgi:hypothetical protein